MCSQEQKTEERKCSLVDHLKGKDYESFWGGGKFESLLDKKDNCNFILRDTSRLAYNLNDDQSKTVDPRVIKFICAAMKALYMYLYKIYLVYVGSSASDIEPLFTDNDPFDECSEYHKLMQFYTKRINRHLPNMTDSGKIDRLCCRLQRALHFVHKMSIHIEITERNVSGY